MHERASAHPGSGVQMAQICVAHGAADLQQLAAQIGYSRAGHRSAPITQCNPSCDRYAEIADGCGSC